MSSLAFFPQNILANLTADKVEMLKQIKVKKNKCSPAPPKLPKNFKWKGSYVVPDLGIRVPFVWNGNDGNIQMIAGNENEPVHFTNLIYDGFLYTLTYKWPGVTDNPTCLKLIPFTREDLNNIFATSAFVGEEIIIDHGNCYPVNHFRLTIVLPPLPPGNFIRFAISEADIYVDINDSSKIRKILHFGYQNLLDPQMDEWIIINKFCDQPGKVLLPECCVNSQVPCISNK